MIRNEILINKIKNENDLNVADENDSLFKLAILTYKIYKNGQAGII